MCSRHRDNSMNLLDLTPPEAERVIAGWVRQRNQPEYRVTQIIARLWQRPVGDWDAVTDLPKDLIKALRNDFPLPRLTLAARQRSSDGTTKFLWELPDRLAVESVLIPERRRCTLCISSQVGCAYQCQFCATGTMGLARNLGPWEIAAQVRELLLGDEPQPTHVVFMGMGEPLHNWSAVDSALTMLNHPKGLGIGARRITVSTIGIVPNLAKLASRPEQFRIAWSIHSAIAEHRLRLMPIERKYPIARVLDALRSFPRRVTLEYVMIKGFNDSAEDTAALSRLALELEAHVNVLPLHPGGSPTLSPASGREIARFARGLTARGVNVTVRRSRGLDIDAACGQLVIESRGREIVAEKHTGVH